MTIKPLFPILCALVIFTSCNTNKTNEMNPLKDSLNIVAQPDYKMSIIARLSVKPERIKDFTDAARDIIDLSNKEAGCTFYQLFQDPYDNTKFVFVEEYKNQAAVDAHFATEYFKAFGPKIGDMIAGAPEIKVISVAKEELK